MSCWPTGRSAIPISSVCNFMDVNPTPTANPLPFSLMRFVVVYQLFFLPVHFCGSELFFCESLKIKGINLFFSKHVTLRFTSEKSKIFLVCLLFSAWLLIWVKGPKFEYSFTVCTIHKPRWNVLFLPPFDWKDAGELSLNQQKQCQNVKQTISENINTTSVLNQSQAALFPGPNHRTQS